MYTLRENFIKKEIVSFSSLHLLHKYQSRKSGKLVGFMFGDQY